MIPARKPLSRILSLGLTAALAVSLSVTAFAAESATEDSVWYADAVSYVAEQDLMPGIDAAASPAAIVTRGELAEVLWNLIGDEQAPASTIAYTDVSAEDPYADAIQWCTENGILYGCGDGTFAPNDPVTREQAAVVLYRATDTVGNELDLTFADADSVSDWALPAAEWAAEVSLLIGTGNNQLSPLNVLTRAELATILMRYDQAAYLKFDYTQAIAAADFKNTGYTVPAASQALQASSASGVTGVVLTGEGNDLYLNAYLAGDAITVTGDGMVSAVDNADGQETALTITDNAFTFTPATLNIKDLTDETVTVTMEDGAVYTIHTLHEYLPILTITADQEPDAGVYTFAIDQFMIRVDTEGNLVYFRYMGFQNSTLANFEPHDLDEGRYYTYFYETRTDLRDPTGGFNSGMFVIMDENYTEQTYVTLQATADHGEGYLDQHEFLLLSPTHWIALSYSREHVSNIPAEAADTPRAYVQACIIQEVDDGQVVTEIDATDYPEFYVNSMTGNEYGASTLSDASSICDYVHMNSIDVDPTTGNLIASLRSQSAIVKFDRTTGDLLWTLGGAGNQFSGLDELTNSNGILFLYQHDAKYVDSSITGNANTISLFDNETNFVSNQTRTLMLELDEENLTGSVINLIQGSDYDDITGASHWGTHCGNVTYQSMESAIIGWGLHVKLDTNSATLGQKPVLSEINPATGELLFEILPNRNPNNTASTASSFMSYRSYKTAD